MKYKYLVQDGKFYSIKHNREYFLVEVCVPELYPNDFNFQGITNIKPTIIEI
jgi:hypothetical protein